MKYILIVIGGGAGALLRYFSTFLVNSLFNGKFMLGTIVVNCAGALLIGLLMSVFEIFSVNVKWKLLIITGFLGGYTTFSAYSYETANYLMNGNIKYAVANVVLSNVLCILFVFLGMWLSKFVTPTL